MSVETLFKNCRNKGITLWVEKDGLHYKAPEGTVTPGILKELKENKAGLISYLTGGKEEKKAPPVTSMAKTEVYQTVIDNIAGISGVNRDRLKDSKNIIDYGIDSIMIAQLASKFQEAFNIDFSVQDIMDNPSIAKIVKVIEKKTGNLKKPVKKTPAAAAKEKAVKTEKAAAPVTKIANGKTYEIKLVDKKLVHKWEEENVFLYNLRRKLPYKLPKELFEKKILPGVSKKDQKTINDHYSYMDDDFSAEKDFDSYYYLKRVPYEISKDAALKFLDNARITGKNRKKLLKYYYRDKKADSFILKESFTEDDELKILRTIKQNKWYINSFEKTALSDILEKFEEVPREDIFFSNFYVKLDHNFFFEHPNEHVPAMMLVEASRQFLIACLHKFYGIPLKGVTFIVTGIQTNFSSYTELHFPSKFVAYPNKIEKKPGYLLEYDFNVSLYQNNIECASFNYVGSVLKKDVFKVLRTERAKMAQQMPRFHARSIFYHSVSITDSSGERHLCKLVDLSESGFQLQLAENFPAAERDFDFIIYFQEIGFVQGKSSLMWQKTENESSFAGFKITRLSKQDRYSLGEAIKRFCYVREEREML